MPPAEWAAWIIDAEENLALTPETFGAKPKSKQQLTNSRARKSSAVLL